MLRFDTVNELVEFSARLPRTKTNKIFRKDVNFRVAYVAFCKAQNVPVSTYSVQIGVGLSTPYAWVDEYKAAIANEVTEPVDEYAELKQAHAEGKVIEMYAFGQWSEVCAPIHWSSHADHYRIKPAEPEYNPTEEFQLADLEPEYKKVLGKISKVSFGVKESRMGLHLEFSMSGSGVSTSECFWDYSMERSEYAHWTETDRDQSAIDTLKLLSKTLLDAKVQTVDELLNKPVELSLDRNMLKSWRILTEVL